MTVPNVIANEVAAAMIQLRRHGAPHVELDGAPTPVSGGSRPMLRSQHGKPHFKPALPTRAIRRQEFGRSATLANRNSDNASSG